MRNVYTNLLLSHVLKCSMVVLVVMGVLFCISEFLSDLGLALLLTSVVWCGELFCVVCVRSREATGFFSEDFFHISIHVFHVFLPISLW